MEEDSSSAHSGLFHGNSQSPPSVRFSLVCFSSVEHTKIANPTNEQVEELHSKLENPEDKYLELQ
jgi:hypothetical protein